MIARNIAERIRLGIRAHLPYDWLGNLLSISNKEARVKIEQFIVSYGGMKIYSEQDESSSQYDIFGAVEYAFFDGSVIRLKGINYDETTQPLGDVQDALRRMSMFDSMKSKLKCANLPTEWSPS